MRVQCPNCGAGGSLPDQNIPPEGLKITCPKCQSAFVVQKSHAETGQESSVEEQFQEGIKLLKQQQVDAAIEKFNLVVLTEPQHAGVYRYLGLAYGQKNLWAEAIQVLRQAITYQPDDLLSLKNLGVAYLKQDKYAEAEQVLQQALQYAPDDEKTQSYYAIATRKLEEQASSGQPQESAPSEVIQEDVSEEIHIHAIEELPQQAPQQDPLTELLDKGAEYLENAQYNSAVEAFQEAIRLMPGKADGYFGLAMVHEARKEWAKAADVYETILEMNPDDSTARENLKFIRKKEKKFNWKFWER